MCFEALDCTMRDILAFDNPVNADIPFGGKPVVLGGDFRQVLPVVQGGTCADTIAASLLKSPLWRYVQIFRRTINMRLTTASSSTAEENALKELAQWVPDVGEGRLPMEKPPGETHASWIQIPPEFLLQSYCF